MQMQPTVTLGQIFVNNSRACTRGASTHKALLCTSMLRSIHLVPQHYMTPAFCSADEADASSASITASQFGKYAANAAHKA